MLLLKTHQSLEMFGKLSKMYYVSCNTLAPSGFLAAQAQSQQVLPIQWVGMATAGIAPLNRYLIVPETLVLGWLGSVLEHRGDRLPIRQVKEP